MRRFNSKGTWHIPSRGKNRKKPRLSEEDLIIVEECYCPNGHSLVDSRVEFRGHPGILIKVKKGNETGAIALSPICGDNSKYSIDIELSDGEILDLLCPHCNVPLPVYAPCDCGGDMITLFADKQGNFCNCIGVCNRVGCSHSEIKNGTELFKIYRRKGEIRGGHG